MTKSYRQPPVHGEVREGVCPSESPAETTKITQNTAASSRGSGKNRAKNRTLLAASKGSDVVELRGRVPYPTWTQGCWLQQFGTTSTEASIVPSQSVWPFDSKRVGQQLHNVLSAILAESGQRVSIQHFLAVGMGNNNWGCRARGFNQSSEGVSKGNFLSEHFFSLRMAHPLPTHLKSLTCKTLTLPLARVSCWKTLLESEVPQFFFYLFVAGLPLQNSYHLFQHFHQ